MEQEKKEERKVDPKDNRLQYCGRLEDEDPGAPVFLLPGSFVRMTFTGSSRVKAVLNNHRFYYDSWVGALLDGHQEKYRIEKDDCPVEVTLFENLSPQETHCVTLFKRMDNCHEFTFLGFLLDPGARVLPSPALPERRMLFFGDSVTAGEVSEALDFAGKPDPPHNGEYHNAYYSYALTAARLLHAQAHLVAQGGIALLDHTGYFMDGQIGMESCHDRIRFYQERGERKRWDPARYRPQVIVVAIGQNDAWPRDIMKEDYEGREAAHWRKRYGEWIRLLRDTYPEAWIVLTTTILFHDENWDKSIGQVCAQLADPKVVQFLYSRNGKGTPGHVRAQEAMEMARELSRFLEPLFGEKG